ncbi:SurA N-terminal domain-containing protein [Luminiphilus sp.]|nr:SurA N-terminal domain-containing protein [Luminiphilus sp.]
MLQNMREGVRSPWVLIPIGLIVLSFVLTGAETLTFGATQSGVATVNGEEISESELQMAIEGQRRQLTEIYGDQIDPSLLSDDLLRPGVLNGLVERALLEDYAAALGVTASSSAVGRAITENPNFQIDGVFSADYYRDILRSNGLTNALYKADQERSDQLVKLESAVSSAAFLTPVEAEAAFNIIAERRDVRYLVVPGSFFEAADNVTEEAIEGYYEKNALSFSQPERLRVAYIELNLDQYTTPVDQAEVDAQLASALADFETKAESEVAHILVTQADDESGEDYAARVDAVRARLDSGEAFTLVAREDSDDIGSASIGGDLGYTDGSVFPDEMELAIEQLSVGDVSPGVVTDAGTHFILLKGKTAAEQVADEVLRAEIADSLQTAQAQQDLLIAVDQLRDAVFTSDGLESAARALGVQVETSAPFSRDEGQGTFNESSVRQAAFSDDVLLDGNNSEVIELSGSRFVALSLLERLPEGIRPLKEVRQSIALQLADKARETAMTALVEEINAEMAAGATLESLATAKNFEWRVELGATRQNVILPASVLQAAFAKRVDDTETVDTVQLDAESFALVQLARAQPGRADTIIGAERASLLQEVSQVQASLLLAEFTADLRRRGDVVTR